MAAHRDLLDLNKLHCNNIHTMAENYGIEAASKVLVKVCIVILCNLINICFVLHDRFIDRDNISTGND